MRYADAVIGFVDRVLRDSGPIVYLLVGLLVFAEDAIFVGFVLPGETAAVLGGVVASRGHASLPLLLVIVVAAAIIGDSVGYEVGARLGPRILRIGLLQKRKRQLDDAQDLLRRRGGTAVFFGRFIAFFRAVMPALAGIAHMRYRRFLAFNAAGGLVWGVGFVMIGYLAGNSYEKVEKVAGRGLAIGVAVLALAALVVWHYRRRGRERS